MMPMRARGCTKVLTEAKILVTRSEAAILLSVSLRTLDHLVAAGELSPRHIGKRVLFARRDLEVFSRGDHATRPARGNGQAGQAAGGGPTS